MASAFKSREFTNAISVSDALYLELFDDVPYKWLIDKLSPTNPRTKRSETTFEITITDCPVKTNVTQHLAEGGMDGCVITTNDCATQFVFELTHKITSKRTEHQTFSKIVTYDTNSPMDIMICENLVFQEEEPEDEE